MSLYRTRPVAPVQVEARRVSGGTAREIAGWCDAIVYTGAMHGHTSPPFTLHTCITLREPDVAAYSGYWVVRHPGGAFEVCDPDEFAGRFEPVMRPAAGLRKMPAAELTDAEYVALLVDNYLRLPDPPPFSLLEFTGMRPDEYAGWIMHGIVPERLMRVAGRSGRR
jgi:hypothetical protein